MVGSNVKKYDSCDIEIKYNNVHNANIESYADNHSNSKDDLENSYSGSTLA